MPNSFLNSLPPRISPIPCSVIVFHKLGIFSSVFTHSGEIPSESMSLHVFGRGVCDCLWPHSLTTCTVEPSLLWLQFED